MGKVSSCFCLCCASHRLDGIHQTNKKSVSTGDSSHTGRNGRVDIGVRYRVHAVHDGPTVDWAERHVLRTLPPPGPRGDPSFFPLRSTAGPCHLVPMSRCPTKPCEAALLLLVVSTSPPSTSPPAQHSTALRLRRAFPTYDAALTPPSPPMLPVPPCLLGPWPLVGLV